MVSPVMNARWRDRVLLLAARAKAWAAAVIEVYADAWATAINVCKCNGKPNAALATTYGSAHEFEYLFAKVEAEASAKVCVRGDDEDWVHADAVCSHKIFAYGFAAVSLPPTPFGCLSLHLSSLARLLRCRRMVAENMRPYGCTEQTCVSDICSTT